MIRLKPAVVSTAIACAALVGAAAFADDQPAEKTKVPQSVDGTPAPGSEPAAKDLDQNAQRQHSRTGEATAAAPGVSSNSKGGETAAGSESGTRYWEKYDKNKDHSMSPEEVEAMLHDAKPAAKTASKQPG